MSRWWVVVILEVSGDRRPLEGEGGFRERKNVWSERERERESNKYVGMISFVGIQIFW